MNSEKHTTKTRLQQPNHALQRDLQANDFRVKPYAINSLFTFYANYEFFPIV